MSAPTVSVIIPCYNQGRYLADAIACVLEQSYTNTEIIVVDDGSSDETPAVACRYGERARYVFQKHRGVSAARNTGIDNSSGAYIQFLDADDKLEKEKILTHVEYLESHPEAGLVYSDVRYFTTADPDMRSYGPAEYGMDRPWVRDTWHAPGSMLVKLARHNAMTVNSPLIRRNVADMIGPWNEEFRGNEDWEYWIRCAAKNIKFHFLDKCGTLALVRMHESSASRNRGMMDRDHFRIYLTTAPLVGHAEFRNASLMPALWCAQSLGPEGRTLRVWRIAMAHRSLRGVAAALMMWLFAEHGPGHRLRCLIAGCLPAPLKRLLRRLTGAI